MSAFDDLPQPAAKSPPLGMNEYGTPVSMHVCSACGDEFTVCPPAGPDFGTGCLAPLCPSYDIERDVDYLLAAGQRIVREENDG
jgi:hypothetical protein